MREMKDSGIEWIGEIPKDWKIGKIKNYCIQIFAGGTPQSNNPQYWDGDIKWIPSGCCKDNKISFAPKTITRKGFENSSTKLIPKNTALVAMTGATCGNVGYLLFDSCANQSVTAFIENKNRASSMYLYYLLIASKEYLLTFRSGGAQGGINVENCKNIVVPIVGLKKQQKIANYLDDKCEKIDRMIAKEQDEIEKLKEYKQSIITEAVTKGVRKSVKIKKCNVEWIHEIPYSWELKKLKYIFKFGKGLPITKEDLKEDGVPVISYGQVHSKENTGVSVSNDLIRYVDTDFKDKYPNCIVKKGEFIFADTSEDLDGCGNAVYNNQNDLLLAGYHSIIFKSESLDNRYFAYLFQTDSWRSQIRCRTSGIKLFSITQKILKEVSICIPPKEDQHEIANYLENKCRKIELIIKGKNKKIEKLKMYQKSLIFECVTGKKEVF